MFGFFIFIFFFIFAILFIIGKVGKVKKNNEELLFLKASGFNCNSYIFLSSPFVAFDHDKKIMAIVKKDKSISLYTAEDIIDHRWEWVERNGLKLNNTITITLKDMKNPIQKIFLYNNEDSAQTLMGKISNL